MNVIRKIKFRGRSVKTKQFVYGFYCKQGIDGLHKILTFNKGFQGFIPTIVEPKTVAQLVGYDKNGKEVYTGDTVISEDGTEYTVKLVPIAENEIEYVRLDTELDNRAFELKEIRHE